MAAFMRTTQSPPSDMLRPLELWLVGHATAALALRFGRTALTCATVTILPLQWSFEFWS